ATDQQILFEVLDDGSASLMKVLAQGSDRNIKKNIESVDTAEILEKITQLPIAEWSYKTDEDSIRHLGPMSQDFYNQFELGADDKHIAPLDGVGLALAAIQELKRQFDTKTQAMQEKIDEQAKLIEQLKSQL
ncbi:MAG: tail fiber domain-containing protein, partial [Chromatiales bacterium]|nr:tail fiber domain-containing protein [Chromatiales bacterium]